MYKTITFFIILFASNLYIKAQVPNPPFPNTNCPYETVVLTEIPCYEPPEFQLVWEDNFDDSGFDFSSASEWKGNIGSAYEGTGTSNDFNKRWYNSNSPTTIIESGGTLKIKADIHSPFDSMYTVNGDTYTNTFEYTSGWIQTKQEFGPYGKYEIRAKCPPNHGLWPALWTHGGGGAVYHYSEIDLIDNIDNGPNRIEFATHSDLDRDIDANGDFDWEECRITTDLGPDISQWHTYTCTYTPERMVLSIDGNEFISIPSHVDMKGSIVSCGVVAYALYQRQITFPLNPMAVHLNLEILAPGGSGFEGPNPSIFPQYLEVDYVRVYEMTSSPCPGLNIAIDPTTGGPLSCITFEGNEITCSNNHVPSGCSTSFKAGEAIHLKQPYFHAKKGSTFHAFIQCDGPGKWLGTEENDIAENEVVEFSEENEIDSSPSRVFSVYPNPNNGQFTIDIQGFDGEGTVEILNTLGQSVYQKTGVNRQLQIDLTDNQRGIYLVRYINGEEVINKKIVKH